MLSKIASNIYKEIYELTNLREQLKKNVNKEPYNSIKINKYLSIESKFGTLLKIYAKVNIDDIYIIFDKYIEMNTLFTLKLFIFPLIRKDKVIMNRMSATLTV